MVLPVEDYGLGCFRDAVASVNSLRARHINRRRSRGADWWGGFRSNKRELWKQEEEGIEVGIAWVIGTMPSCNINFNVLFFCTFSLQHLGIGIEYPRRAWSHYNRLAYDDEDTGGCRCVLEKRASLLLIRSIHDQVTSTTSRLAHLPSYLNPDIFGWRHNPISHVQAVLNTLY